MKTLFNKVNNSVELTINDEIGFWGVTHQDFKAQLDEIGDSDVQLNISSFGGSVNDAKNIYNMLKSHKGKIIANIYGDSASSATIIALAADEVVMANNAFWLIHNVWGMVVGNSGDLIKAAKEMDQEDKWISELYAQKTGASVEEIMSLMSKEDWITASEAKELGFVDRVVDSTEILNRKDLVLQNCADQKLQKQLLNKINNQKQTEMLHEDDKNWFKDLFNSKAKQEAADAKKDSDKTEMEDFKNGIEIELKAIAESNEAKIKSLTESKDAEISALKAENEKLNIKSSDVQGDEGADTDEEEEENSEFSPFENKLRAKYAETIKQAKF